MLQALPWIVFAIAGTPLAVIDGRTHRLPNRGVVILSAAMLVTLIVVATADGTLQHMYRAVLGGVALALVFLVCAFVSPPSLGMGDVKVAWVVGAALTWLGWSWLWLGCLVAFSGAALWVLVQRVRRGHLGPVPLGPFLIAAPLGCALIAWAI